MERRQKGISESVQCVFYFIVVVVALFPPHIRLAAHLYAKILKLIPCEFANMAVINSRICFILINLYAMIQQTKSMSIDIDGYVCGVPLYQNQNA